MSAPATLTPQEGAVIDLLAEAWNAFLQLRVKHGDDVAEFRHSIHALQNQILARPARRTLNSTPGFKGDGR